VDEGVAATFAALHIVFERVLVASFLLHLAGALKHHFIDRDDTLRRMWPGALKTVPDVAAHQSRMLPIVGAGAAYVLAIGIGIGLGVFAKESTATQVAALEAVETGWQVQEGTLGISITQLGSEVQGSFADWTAAIDFSETATDGSHGTVEVTIAIGSLTLGSVTDQAMGADFFDAGQFPKATFAADILPGLNEGSYVARGTLTLKGQTADVEMPFTLSIDGDTATMEGETVLDRQSFGIGVTYKDESSVGFSVPVRVALTANRV
ncbi:MAG: YceI family protein, partial [Pseudomonadota bacterium]